MSEYDNTNRGALFPNDKGDNPNRPDYTGTINVAGTEFKLAGWLKTSKAGKRFLSLNIKPADENQPQRPRKAVPTASDGFAGPSAAPDLDEDDIPF